MVFLVLVVNEYTPKLALRKKEEAREEDEEQEKIKKKTPARVGETF